MFNASDPTVCFALELKINGWVIDWFGCGTGCGDTGMGERTCGESTTLLSLLRSNWLIFAPDSSRHCPCSIFIDSCAACAVVVTSAQGLDKGK